MGPDRIRLDRRTFLAATGLGFAAIAAAPVVRGAAGRGPAAPTHGFGQQLPGDPVIDALALSLEYDLERIYRFVADEIRYEPYPGILRGAAGTAWSRAGNAADQAMLLAALLDASAIAYRFATGTIDDTTAAALLDGGVHDAASAVAESVASLRGDGLGLPVPAMDPPDAATTAAVDAAVQGSQAAGAWIRDRFSEDVALIDGALRDAGISLPVATTTVPPVERTRHLWVQASVGSEWLDLDPSLPGRTPGDTLATGATPLDGPPEELWHQVELAVIAEVISEGALTEVPQLLVTHRTTDIDGQPIVCFNAHAEGLAGIGITIAADLSGRSNYVAALVVGEEASVGRTPISFAVSDAPFGSNADALEGEPTAQWLQLTLTGPDAAPVVVRRPLFDRIGPAARSAEVLDPATISPIGSVTLQPDTPPDVVEAMTMHWLSISGARSAGAWLRESAPALGSYLEPYLVPATMRVTESSIAQQTAGGAGCWLFPDAPNVVGVTMTVSGEDIVVHRAVDVWHRSLGQTLLRGAAPPSIAPGIMAGVVPHVVERVVAGEAAAGRGGPSTPVGTSVGALFGAAAAQGVGTVVVRDAAAVDALPYPADARARLRAAIAAGLVAVVPGTPVAIGGVERTGWWLVDPLTGRTADQLDDGRGVAIPERVIIVPLEVEQASVWVKLACAAAGAAALAAAAFTLILFKFYADDTTGAILLILCASGETGAAAMMAQMCIQG